MTEIVSVRNATGITVADELTLSGFEGETYEIRRAKTLNDIFGSNSEAGLAAGSEASADIIRIPREGSIEVFYHDGLKWTPIGAPQTDAGTTPILRTEALFIERKSDIPLDLVVVGHVHTVPVPVSLSTGFNYYSIVFPVGQTLATSGLGDRLQSGVAPEIADVVWVADGSGEFARYFYKEGGLGPSGLWLDSGGGFTDRGDTPLSSGIIIQRRGARTIVTIEFPDFHVNL